MRKSPATFDRIAIATDSLAPDAVACARCRAVLEIHQPDSERPDRLLGTCADCGSWFLIDDDAHVMIALPDLRPHRDN